MKEAIYIDVSPENDVSIIISSLIALNKVCTVWLLEDKECIETKNELSLP